ncbi:MAG TPA: hypothetical protein VFI34_00145 [Candidatus Limnocylindrales bacterium]|nr:hypothetical protein [Candidatus Limnocylindrales bacterium]
MSRRLAARIGLVAIVAWLAFVGIALVNASAPQPHPSPSEVALGDEVAASTAVTPSVEVPRATKPSVSPTPPAAPTPAAALSAIRPGSVNRSSLNLTATYAVRLNVSWATRGVTAATTIAVTNTSGVAIDRLELNTIAARLGGIAIRSATVDGSAVTPTVSDQTIRVPLGGILDPGAAATVRLTYHATLRSTTSGSTWLFTRANGVLEMHRWIPWISRATPFDRPNHGDPFVTPVSPHVRVTIVSDRVIAWATTGDKVSGTGTSRTYDATNVRDFAIVGAPDFGTSTASVGGVTIRVWGRPGFPRSTILAAARTALSREANRLGAYPYRTYDLAQTAGGYGMESPQLTWIPTGAGSLGYLVAHETAHQWFYGIVGNDQARNPYADEAAADMVARNVLGLRRASRCATARLDLSIYRYSSTCYYEDIYIQGGNFLDDLRKSMGTTRYWNAIRAYLTANRFKLSTTQRLLTAIDAGTPLDFRSRYHARFPSIF